MIEYRSSVNNKLFRSQGALRVSGERSIKSVANGRKEEESMNERIILNIK